MSEKSTTTIDKRTRNWTFIFYPESAPEDYWDILTQECSKFAVSPLHDKDTNADGTPKKPHYHCLLCFEGKKSYSQIKEITDKLNAPIPKICNSSVGMLRYFTHKDNPEKAQYSESDIRAGNGFDISEVVGLTPTEKRAIIREITEYIINNDIIEFYDLVVYSLENNDKWFEVLQSGYTIYITSLIKSNRHSLQRQKMRAEEQEKAFLSIDPETGEIKEGADK